MQRLLSSYNFVSFVVLVATIACAQDVSPAQRAKDALIVKTLQRLPSVDLSSKPEAKAALLRHLETLKGTEQYLTLVEKFRLREASNELLRLALEGSDESLGVKAAGLVLKLDGRDLLQRAINDTDPAKSAKIVSVLGLLSDASTNELLQPLVKDPQRPLAVRTAAVAAIGRNAPGQKWLLSLVEQNKLPTELKFAAANSLLSSPDETIRTAAAKHLSLPAAAGGKPIPPIAELVKLTGDSARGKELFATTGTCAKCHKLRGEGKDVGPDLSEIGSKLSKEAMYLSILDPSAGVSFNYETWLIRTFDGTVLTGILTSQTDDSVELKTAEAIVHKLSRDDIEQMKKSPQSIMPADIQKLVQVQDLVDIVEYMTTLKKLD